MGLVLSSLALLLLTITMTYWDNPIKISGFNADTFSAIVFGGGFGIIVSILGRIEQFSKMNDTSVLSLQDVFAIFICALFQSSLLPFKEIDELESTFLAFSFLAGFSERFGSSMAEKSEKLVRGVKVAIRT